MTGMRGRGAARGAAATVVRALAALLPVGEAGGIGQAPPTGAQ